MREIKRQLEIENIIVNNCNEEEYNKYQNYTKYLQEHLEENSLVDAVEALMSIPTYYHISKLITFPKNTIVVDVGCGQAIQQILFKNCYKYIGIDNFNYNNQKIVNNVEFMFGDMNEILPTIHEEKGYDLFGISVCCCSYFGLEEFKKKFRYFVSI